MTLLPASLRHHRRRFGRAPDTLTADRNFSTQANVRRAKRAGVRRVALPAFAGRRLTDRAIERQRRFRQAYRFRVGCEGCISAVGRAAVGAAGRDQVAANPVMCCAGIPQMCTQRRRRGRTSRSLRQRGRPPRR